MAKKSASPISRLVVVGFVNMTGSWVDRESDQKLLTNRLQDVPRANRARMITTKARTRGDTMFLALNPERYIKIRRLIASGYLPDSEATIETSLPMPENVLVVNLNVSVKNGEQMPSREALYKRCQKMAERKRYVIARNVVVKPAETPAPTTAAAPEVAATAPAPAAAPVVAPEAAPAATTTTTPTSEAPPANVPASAPAPEASTLTPGPGEATIIQLKPTDTTAAANGTEEIDANRPKSPDDPKEEVAEKAPDPQAHAEGLPQTREGQLVESQ